MRGGGADDRERPAVAASLGRRITVGRSPRARKQYCFCAGLASAVLRPTSDGHGGENVGVSGSKFLA